MIARAVLAGLILQHVHFLTALCHTVVRPRRLRGLGAGQNLAGQAYVIFGTVRQSLPGKVQAPST